MNNENKKLLIWVGAATGLLAVIVFLVPTIGLKIVGGYWIGYWSHSYLATLLSK